MRKIRQRELTWIDRMNAASEVNRRLLFTFFEAQFSWAIAINEFNKALMNNVKAVRAMSRVTATRESHFGEHAVIFADFGGKA